MEPSEEASFEAQLHKQLLLRNTQHDGLQEDGASNGLFPLTLLYGLAIVLVGASSSFKASASDLVGLIYSRLLKLPGFNCEGICFETLIYCRL